LKRLTDIIKVSIVSTLRNSSHYPVLCWNLPYTDLKLYKGMCHLYSSHGKKFSDENVLSLAFAAQI
jgi:hypothetical protein